MTIGSNGRRSFLVLLEEAENAEQEGKSGDTAEQSARRKKLEVELKTEPGYLALRRALVHEFGRWREQKRRGLKLPARGDEDVGGRGRAVHLLCLIKCDKGRYHTLK